MKARRFDVPKASFPPGVGTLLFGTCTLLAAIAHGCSSGSNNACTSDSTCADAGAPSDAFFVEPPFDASATLQDGDSSGAISEGAPGDGGCDPTQSPHDAPCVIDELFGVFVSPAGADSNPGTRASPVRTLGRGLDLAKANGKLRAYVCTGTFNEALVLGASRDGVSLYGGLDCAAWTYGPQNRVVVSPSQAGYALDIEGLMLGADFEDVEFDAESASPSIPGASSMAVFVSASQNVRFTRAVLVAGAATDAAQAPSGSASADGGAMAPRTNWLGTPPNHPELDGNAASGAVGAPQKMCVCPDGTTSTGGQGGGRAASADAGVQMPQPGLPSYAYDGDGGAGDGASDGEANGAPCPAPSQLSGLDAPASPAALPSTLWGALGPTGWTPAPGAIGTNGQPGQGGIGGGNGPSGSGGGGSGACGGCGGAGGLPGNAGGSSIALLAYQSSVALVACTLTSAGAGRGGSGGSGEAGEPGGARGGAGAGGGCAAGPGGSGSGGSGGQGGPGGLSLGIGYTDVPPSFDGTAVSPGMPLTRVSLGAAGAAGPAGSGGPAAAATQGQPQPGAGGPPGVAGIAQAVLEL